MVELRLTKVESAKSPTSEWYVVRLDMDVPSFSQFASYTATHINDQLAFISSGVVVFATKITGPTNSASIEISPEMTAEKAYTIVRLLRQPA